MASLLHGSLLGVGVMAILGGELWPDWVLWPGAAVALVFLARSLAVVVIFHDEGIVIRNILHTYRIARREVTGLGGGWYYVALARGEVGAAEVRTNRERIPKRWGPASWATSPFNLMDFFGTPRPLLKVGVAASVLRSKRQRQRFVQDFNMAASSFGYVSGLTEPDLNRFF
jgi:hypothetical protein